MKNRKRIIWSLVLATATMLSGCGEMAVPDEEQTEQVMETAKVITAQSDFYGYVNKDKLLTMEISYGQNSAGTFQEVDKQVTQQLKTMVQEIVQSKEVYEEGSSEARIRAAYEQMKDYSASEEQKKQFCRKLEKEIDSIMKLSTMEEVYQEMEILQSTYECASIFGLAVAPNYLNNREYCIMAPQTTSLLGVSLEDINESQNQAQNVETMVAEALTVTGLSYKEGKEYGKKLAYLALELAWNTDYDIANANNPYATLQFVSTKELKEIFTNVEVSKLEKIIGIDQNPYGGWIVQDTQQLRTLNSFLVEENLDALKGFMVCMLTNQYGYYLADFYPSFGSKYPSGEKYQEEFYIQNLSKYYSEDLNRCYVKRYYSPEMEEAILELCETVREGYRVKISGCEWLSEEGKNLLLQKLERIDFITGYKAVEDQEYEKQPLGGNWMETLLLYNQGHQKYTNGNVGKEITKKEAGMTMYTTNACFAPNNTVTITVAIMGGDFFQTDRDFYENLGGLGAVVAHEVGHGFDSNCIAWDTEGVYRPDWLPAQDLENMEKRNRKAVSYFEDLFTVFGVYRVNGEKTLGENYADLSAMECILELCHTREQKQKVLESYAGVWRELAIEDMVISQIDVDVHSPAVIRVNAIMGCLDAFYEIYDVKEGDEMYIAPENRISRW